MPQEEEKEQEQEQEQEQRWLYPIFVSRVMYLLDQLGSTQVEKKNIKEHKKKIKTHVDVSTTTIQTKILPRLKTKSTTKNWHCLNQICFVLDTNITYPH